MGFFSALGKIIQGKPVFEPGQQGKAPTPAAGQPAAPAPGPAPVATPGLKVYPRVQITRTVSATQGSNMTVDIYIKNDSLGQVDVDRLDMLGKSSDLGTFLRPGEERQFRVYDGPRPTNTSMANLELNFKDATGDYFCADHTIEFQQQADGTYTTDRIRFIRTRDV